MTRRTTRPPLAASAVVAIVALLAASCGDTGSAGEVSVDAAQSTIQTAQEATGPEFPDPPEGVTEADHPAVEVIEAPSAKSNFQPLSLEDRRFAGDAPVEVFARPSGEPLPALFEHTGPAVVRVAGDRFLLESELVTIALRFPKQLPPPEFGDGEEVEIKLRNADDPSETAGANRQLEIRGQKGAVAGLSWRNSDRPISFDLLGINYAQEPTEPNGRTDYTEVATVVAGEVKLAVLEPVEIDAQIVTALSSHRFDPEEAETFGSGYVLRVWATGGK